VGLLLLAGGNAFVVWSEQYVGSGSQHLSLSRRDVDRLIDAIFRRFRAAELACHRPDCCSVSWEPSAGRCHARRILAADKRGPAGAHDASASWSLGTVYAKRHPRRPARTWAPHFK